VKDPSNQAVKNEVTDLLNGTLGYLTEGIGLKVYNPAFSTGGGINALEPAGAAFFGFGADGAGINLSDKLTGSWGAEIYGAANFANRYELKNIYLRGGTPTEFFTVTGQMQFVFGPTNLSLFYSFSPAGATARRMLRDMAGLSFTFAPPVTPTK